MDWATGRRMEEEFRKRERAGDAGLVQLSLLFGPAPDRPTLAICLAPLYISIVSSGESGAV